MTRKEVVVRPANGINGWLGDVLPPIPSSPTSLLPAPDSSRRTNSQAQQQAITTRAPNQRLRAVWGSNIQVGGIIGYENIGSNNGYLVVVVLVSHGPIGGMAFTVDGQPLANLGFNNGNVSTTGGYEVFLGTKTQAVSTILTACVPAWTSSLPGIAYAVIQYGPQGQFPNYGSFKAQVSFGLQCLDPRNGVDVNGIPNTARVSTDNPALIWADARTARRYGVGDPLASIDWTDVTAAANDCDFNIGGGVKRFVMGHVLENASPLNPEQITQDICRYAALQEARYNGKWHVWVDKAQAASGLTLLEGNPGDANSDIVYATFREKGRSEVFTRVRVHFVDSTKNYSDSSREYADPRVDQNTLEDVMAEYTLSCVPDAQALRLATQYQKRAGKQRQYFINGGPRLTKLVPGIRFSATSNQWGANVTKDLICTSLQNQGTNWQVTAEEYDAAVYPA